MQYLNGYFSGCTHDIAKMSVYCYTIIALLLLHFSNVVNTICYFCGKKVGHKNGILFGFEQNPFNIAKGYSVTAD